MALNGHVKRIYSPNRISWVDILRRDEVVANSSGQIKRLVFDWSDEVNEGVGPAREYEDFDLVPPEGSGGEPITLKILSSMVFRNNGQLVRWYFNNAANNGARTTAVKRVVSRYDVNVDPETPMSWADYQSAMSNVEINTGQFIDVAVVDTFASSSSGQVRTFYFDNQEPKNFIGNEEALLDPVFLDPFQTIVNVSWGGFVDLMHVVDASGSNANYNDAALVQYGKDIYKTYPGSRQGYANFIDFPYDPYGGPGDFVYRRFSPLLEESRQSYSLWRQFDGYGGDGPEAQLDALIQCANDTGVGWTLQRPQVILIHTDTIPHEGTPHATKTAAITTLKAKRIYPIYIGYQYSLGFGETILTPSSALILNAIKRGIDWWNTTYNSGTGT